MHYDNVIVSFIVINATSVGWMGLSINLYLQWWINGNHNVPYKYNSNSFYTSMCQNGFFLYNAVNNGSSRVGYLRAGQETFIWKVTF